MGPSARQPLPGLAWPLHEAGLGAAEAGLGAAVPSAAMPTPTPPLALSNHESVSSTLPLSLPLTVGITQLLPLVGGPSILVADDAACPWHQAERHEESTKMLQEMDKGAHGGPGRGQGDKKKCHKDVADASQLPRLEYFFSTVRVAKAADGGQEGGTKRPRIESSDVDSAATDAE